MKIAGMACVLLSAATGAVLALRTVASSDTGVVMFKGWWQGSGVKGDSSLDPLPPRAAELALEGDRVFCTEVWNPDLRMGYTCLRLERSGTSLGRFTDRAVRFYAILAGLGAALLVGVVLPRRRRSAPRFD
jgi:hypothetical protein